MSQLPVYRRVLLASLVTAFLPLFAMAQQTQLSYDDLFKTQALESPLPDAVFAVPASARPSSQKFEGRLELVLPTGDAAGYGYGTIVSTKYDSVRKDLSWKRLPKFDLEFVQNADRLIPVRQGLVITGSYAWNLIIGAGRVWEQPDDHGYSRASLPFALIERSQNCVHNGSMTFLFSNTKTPAISHVRYQVTQETCAYMKFDLWGQVPAKYTHASVANAAQIKQAFQLEMNRRVPRKPLTDLPKDHPEAGFDIAALLRGRKRPEDVTMYGIYMDGVHYASNCPTRFGEYAFCDEMRLPSYSTAKSAFTGMAMMRLGKMYGPDIYTEKLEKHLPDVGQGNTWKDVTFSNALDMATGHFLSPGFEKDEDGPEMKFLNAEDYTEKMKDALLTFPSKASPGTTWVYQSHDTFLATNAMDSLLKQREGQKADLFRLVSDDIYKPLEVSQGMLTTLRTGNSETGAPDGYFGLFYIQDDVVKLAKFLNQGTGVISRKPVLDAKRLQQSLFRDPSTTGMTTTDPRQLAGTVHYNHAFWGRHFTHEEYNQLPCDFWAPYMSGYGGISIVMLPNGVVFYVFSDSNEFVFNDAVLEINKTKPLCRATSK